MKLFTVTETSTLGIKARDVDGVLQMGEGLGRLLSGHPDALMLTGDIVPFNAEPKPGLRIVNERHPNDRVALVLVATSPGLGGSLWLTSNCMEEKVDGWRVIRSAKPLKEAAGIEVVGGNDNNIVLRMLPGSSFRICRDGRLDGASPELTVLWSGRYNPNDPQGGMRVFERKNRTGLS